MKIRILIYILILFVFFLSGFLVSQYTGKAVYSEKIEKANLTRAVDGDTIETSIGKIRMLGINTPEKNQRGYQEAKDFLINFTGKEIELEKTIEDKDLYGRYLRYVFLDNRFLNKEILENGYAHFYTYNEDKYTDELRKAEETAITKGIGIWEKSQDKCGDCIKLEELNWKDPGEYIILGNRCDFSCNLKDWTIDDDSSSHTKKISINLEGNKGIKIPYNGSIWNDKGDSLYLRDKSGYLVLFYRYVN